MGFIIMGLYEFVIICKHLTRIFKTKLVTSFSEESKEKLSLEMIRVFIEKCWKSLIVLQTFYKVSVQKATSFSSNESVSKTNNILYMLNKIVFR